MRNPNIFVKQSSRFLLKLIFEEYQFDENSNNDDKSVLVMSIINALELLEMEFPPVDFLIDEFLPRNLCLLAGPPKIGKSLLTLSFMGPILTKGMEVYYFSFEDDYRRLKSRLTALNLNDKGLRIHCGREGPLGSTEVEEFNKIQRIAMKSNVSLVVLDTMERILPPQKERGIIITSLRR